MSTRRRNAYRKSREAGLNPSGVKERRFEEPGPAATDCEHRFTTGPAKERQPVEGHVPVAVVMEILAGEYDESAGGEALCRAAARLAEETGLIHRYRSVWDAEADDPVGNLPPLIFDRSQCLELIKYHQRKGNMGNLQKETERLRLIEGRLLLGSAPRANVRITESDLRKLEEFIKESGF
ncbi:MAG TPA: hypothetical protein PK728_04005 [Bacillota bacterium]|nr:hypothetical protein [Bacillota bacterium]